MIRKDYIINNLDCAHCAAKIESEVAKMPYVKQCRLAFASKSLTVELSQDITDFDMHLTKLVDSVEPGTIIKPKKSAFQTETDDHEHGHEHGHDHSHSKSNKRDIAEIIIAVVCTVTGYIMMAVELPVWSYAIIFGLAAIISGYSVFISAIKNLVKIQINENLLMSIAVIAAFIIGEYPEAALVAVLFRIGETLEHYAVGKSRKSIQSLAQIRPDTAYKLLDNGEVLETDARQIKAGEHIVIKPFERVPLDGIILEGKSSLDSSAITGESVPVECMEGSKILSGMVNGSGLLKVQVTGEFEQSTASRILSMVEDAASRKGNTEKLMTRFAKIYTPAVMIAAVCVAVFPPLFGFGAFTTWLMRALVFLVASCPCAIVISVPLCFFAGIGAASRKGVLVKGSKFIEAAAEANTVILDKTGTLTEGRLEIKKVISTGNLSEKQVIELMAAAEEYSSHPAAMAIKNYAGQTNIVLDDYIELPGIGVGAKYNGNIIKCGSKRLLKDVELNNDIKDASVFLLINGKLEGAAVVGDVPRKEAAKAISQLKNIGIKRIAILTGDNEEAAKKVASQCGIEEYHANLMPEDKLRILDEIRKESGKVIFVGDGINDAPVLAAADAGAAMGLGTDAAIEAADMVISSDRLTGLPKAISLFRKVLNKAKFNIVFALAIKAAVLITAVFGIAPMWLAVFADVGVTIIAVINSYMIKD